MENLYTGGQLAVKLMEEFGVKVAFGIPGGQTLSVNNAMYDSTIRFVHTRHENGAAVAADGELCLDSEILVKGERRIFADSNVVVKGHHRAVCRA